MHANTPSTLKPIGPSANVPCISLVAAGAVLPRGSNGQVAGPEVMPACALMSPPWQQPAGLSWFITHESHTYIRGNITFAVCVRLQRPPEIPFYGRGSYMCMYMYINIQTVCEVYCTLVGITTCASGVFSPVCERVFVRSPATALINSCHYRWWGSCKLVWPVQSDALSDPSSCWYTQPLRRNHDEALSPSLLSTHTSCCPCAPSPIGYSHMWTAIAQHVAAKHASPFSCYGDIDHQ